MHSIFKVSRCFKPKFDKKWQEVLTFGEQGNEPGQFQYPLCVSIAANDLLYIADLNNNRIQIFTSFGQYLSTIEHEETPLEAPCLTKIDSPRLELSYLNFTALLRISRSGPQIRSYPPSPQGTVLRTPPPPQVQPGPPRARSWPCRAGAKPRWPRLCDQSSLQHAHVDMRRPRSRRHQPPVYRPARSRVTGLPDFRRRDF